MLHHYFCSHMNTVWVLDDLFALTTSCPTIMCSPFSIFSASFPRKSMGEPAGRVKSCCHLLRALPHISGGLLKELPAKWSWSCLVGLRNRVQILKIFTYRGAGVLCWAAEPELKSLYLHAARGVFSCAWWEAELFSGQFFQPELVLQKQEGAKI